MTYIYLCIVQYIQIDRQSDGQNYLLLLLLPLFIYTLKCSMREILFSLPHSLCVCMCISLTVFYLLFKDIDLYIHIKLIGFTINQLQTTKRKILLPYVHLILKFTPLYIYITRTHFLTCVCSKHINHLQGTQTQIIIIIIMSNE